MLKRLRRLFTQTGAEILLLYRACRHPLTSWRIKLAAGLLVLYVLSPIDLIPDWFPILGWIDDVTLLALMIPLLLRRVPTTVIDQLKQHKPL